MPYSAKVIEDSISEAGKPLTTYLLTYPRFIHAEAKTHRVLRSGDDMIEILEEVSLMDDENLSRNASSSRAIPVLKMIDRIVADPAQFVHIGQNQPGMQAKLEVAPEIKDKFLNEWLQLMHISADFARRWAGEYGIHKQVANRAMEPWQSITVVVTATEWDGFFELRDHEDAQPEIRHLARLMKIAKLDSIPTVRGADPKHESSWHLPFIGRAERRDFANDPQFLARLSTARCARTSYLNHDGTTPVISKDVQLFDDLVGARPLHASPTEHQAHALEDATARSKNLIGWNQFRGFVEHLFY